jgi:hypothetical protein
MGFPLGMAKMGAGQGGCLLLGAALLTLPPTKTWQTVMMARAGTSLLTGLHVTTVQSLVEVVGMGFLLGAAAAGAIQGGCLLPGAELLTPPPTKTRRHQLRMMETTTVLYPKAQRMAMIWGQVEMELHSVA